MKLYELLDVIDYNRESQNEKLQICTKDGWDEFDEVLTSSMLLLPLYKADVKAVGAIEENVIRVDIDWDKLDKEVHLYDWDKSVH